MVNIQVWLQIIYKKIKEKYNLPIKLIPTKTWSESITKAKNKECDILSAVAITKERKEYLKFTDHYLKFPQVIATQSNQPFIDDFNSIINKKIGVVKNSAVASLLKQKYPNINLVDLKNVTEGLYKVSSGELYGFVNTSASVSYYIQKTGLTNIKIASKVGIDYFIRIAVRDDEPVLLDILNNAINDLDKKTVQDIKDRWLKVKVQNIVDYSIVYQLLTLFISILLVVIYWNRRLKKEVQDKEKLQKELDKLSQVVEQSQVSIMITDTEGVIEYVNPYFELSCGYSQDELIGQNPRILKSGYQDDNFYKNIWHLITNGATWHGEISNKKKDGTIYWESAVIAPIFDKENKIKSFTAIKEDITQKVKDRETIQLAQENAIKANNAKSEFLAKMSHEIRTPMNAVLGMLYLLEKTDISDIQENYIKKAGHAANALLSLINDILDFSKIEAGKLDIKEDEFLFSEMINNVLSVLSHQAEEKNIELLVNYDSTIPQYLISDQLRIGQVLNNLISNAIKFTKDGEILVSTKLIQKTKDRVDILFCIRDNGIGISKDKQNKLFKEFSQVDDSQTRSFQGTGLGLAISKKLTKLLGGDIWLEDSKENFGSTFCFSIKSKISHKTKKIEVESQKNIKGLKILIIDDNQNAIEVLQTMLESFHYQVDSCLSGKEAIELVKTNRYDMIFLDFKMEPLNGLETFKQMKNDLLKHNTKSVLVTAYSNEIIEDEIEELKIDGYLSKPISPSTLFDKIVEIYSPNDKEKNNICIDGDCKIEKQFKGDILLVEDNELNREFAIAMLNSRGLNVDIACDGIEALAKVKDNIYDLVLMDIQMPKMDGLEATKNIRKMDGNYYKELPIIALSANALLGDKEKSISAGMNNHITKPVEPEQLFDMFNQYLKSNDDRLKVDIDQEVEENFSKLNRDIFEVEKVLNRLNGSKKTYLKILKQFKDHYNNIFKNIEQLISSNSLVEAEAKVHEIKGISGNIGASELFDKLSVIDTTLKKSQIPTKQLLDDTKISLDKVLNNISQLEDTTIESQNFNKQKVLEYLNNILLNLEEDIVKCEENIELVVPYLQASYKDFADNLSNAIEQFDTDEAKNLIEQFKKEIDG